MKQLTLTEIWVYPVKSLGGISLNYSKVLEKGLAFDRRWMLVDEAGQFLTQRIHPKMALFKLAINGDHLYIVFQDPTLPKVNQPSINFNASLPPLGEVYTAKIWDDDVAVIEIDRTISKWFSSCLDIPCRLVNFPETHPRVIEPQSKLNNVHVSLADAYPFLIIGQSSLNDLNTRLKDPVPMNRFRPNFVYKGGEAYEEDLWKNFSIGGNKFAGVKPCARCVVTTINQVTGEKGFEPLLTLSHYRKKENKVLFGQNVIAIDQTAVAVGDLISVEQ